MSKANGTKARALRDKILNNARNTRSERVHLEVLDLDVEIRALKAREALDIRAAAKEGEEQKINEAKLHGATIVASVFEPESGEPVFGPADRDAILDMLGLAAFQEIVGHATRVSGMPDKATDEEIEKNSPTPTSDSPSTSPKSSE